MTILTAYLNEVGNGTVVFESGVIANDTIRIVGNGWQPLGSIPTGAGGNLVFYEGPAPVGSPVFSADLPDGTYIQLIRADSELLGPAFLTAAASGSGGAGPPGPPGTPGAPGEDAYHEWLDAGHTGTMAQFLASLQGPPGPPGPPGTGTGSTQDPTQFASYVQAAFDGDYTLNWLGGNVTLTAPIVLEITTTWKFAFGIRLNGAKVTSNFNDATLPAITARMQVVNGAVVQNVGMRNFQFVDGHFDALTPYFGALRLECRTNHSWIGTFLIDNCTFESHTGYPVDLIGSVFEGRVSNCVSNGLGFHARTCGLVDPDPTGADTDKGLPSALEIVNPRFRDAGPGTYGSILLDAATEYQEPFDLTVTGGYIVDNYCDAIYAPAGLKLVDGTGTEGNLGTEVIYCGYRGGIFRSVTGANPTALPDGTSYPLVRAVLAGGSVEMTDCAMQNELSGTGAILVDVSGGGNYLTLNNSGTQNADGTFSDVVIHPTWNNTGPSATLRIAQYGPK